MMAKWLPGGAAADGGVASVAPAVAVLHCVSYRWPCCYINWWNVFVCTILMIVMLGRGLLCVFKMYVVLQHIKCDDNVCVRIQLHNIHLIRYGAHGEPAHAHSLARLYVEQRFGSMRRWHSQKHRPSKHALIVCDMYFGTCEPMCEHVSSISTLLLFGQKCCHC